MKFQARVKEWLMECFGVAIASDKVERNHRFLEEALEVVQAAGCTKEEALQLVEYVFARPVGELHQELGGAMTTLTALAQAHDLSLEYCANLELDRISKPDMVMKIRAKQAAKPKFGPLPQ